MPKAIRRFQHLLARAALIAPCALPIAWAQAPVASELPDARARFERLQQTMGEVLTRGGQGAAVAAHAARRGVGASIPQVVAGVSTDDPALARGKALGVVLRLRDRALQQQLEAGEGLPTPLLQSLSATAGLPLVYARPMSGGQIVLRFQAMRPLVEVIGVAERLGSHEAVEHAELDLLVPPQRTSNDPYAAQQWALSDAAGGSPGGIGIAGLWDYLVGTNTIVAVVDSGVVAHPEFASRLLPGYDFVSTTIGNRDRSARDADATDPGNWKLAGECGPAEPASASSWHGTHVTGIIAAAGDNGIGVAGVNWRARVLPVRVLASCGGSVADIVDGIRWAAGLRVPGVPDNRNPAQVINLSLGGFSPYGCQRSYREAIAEARGQGALLVVAAGNSTDDYSKYVPANCEGVLTVTAIDPLANLASYSNYSFRADIAAPGGDMKRYGVPGGILSTVGLGSTTLSGYGFDWMDGTSMAAPFVSGIASIALGLNPNMSGEEMRFVVELSATPFPAGSDCMRIPVCGSGVVSAVGAAALAAVMADYQLVYEFYNEDLNHYFRTGAKGEAALVNRGAAGAGWYDTGSYFYGWAGPVDGAQPVCRFYGTPGRGPNSHFYTASAAECEFVKRDPGWTYEGIAFYAKLPLANGSCPTDSIPVYRVYNNRWRQNDSNHRYTTERAVYDQMVARGWAPEGVTLCAFA